MEIHESLYKKLIRKDKAEIAHAVRLAGFQSEKNVLPVMAEALTDWAGRQLWIQGYGLEDLKLFKKDYDYGKGLGMGIEIDAERIPLTVRQFCYEYVILAECVKQENEKLKSFWLYRLMSWLSRKKQG